MDRSQQRMIAWVGVGLTSLFGAALCAIVGDPAGLAMVAILGTTAAVGVWYAAETARLADATASMAESSAAATGVAIRPNVKVIGKPIDAQQDRAWVVNNGRGPAKDVRVTGIWEGPRTEVIIPSVDLPVASLVQLPNKVFSSMGILIRYEDRLREAYHATYVRVAPGEWARTLWDGREFLEEPQG